MSSQALHHAIVVVDVERFSDAARGDLHRSSVQVALVSSLRLAFGEAGIDWRACRYHERGDGALILVPPHIPENQLVDRLPSRLAAQLRRHNALAAPGAQIRLRLAMHSGPVTIAPNGSPNTAVIAAFRLVDAPAAKAAQKASADLVTVIVSQPFFDDIVRNEPAAEPELYRQVRVAVKEFRSIAYIRIGTKPAGQSENPPALRQVREVVETLTGTAFLHDADCRRQLLTLLPGQYSAKMSADLDLSAFAWALAEVCLTYNRGLDDLGTAMRALELDRASRPSLVASPIRENISPPVSRLIEALYTMPCLAKRTTSLLVVEQLSDRLGERLVVPGIPGTRSYIRHLGEHCQRHSLVPVLVEVVSVIETAPEPLAHLRRVADDVTSMPLAAGVFTSDQKAELLQLLKGLVLPEIGALYRISGDRTAPDLGEHTSYEEILEALESLNARADGVPRTLVFVEQIAARVESELKIRLRQWTRARAVEMALGDELLDVREEVRQALNVPAPATPAKLIGFLVIRIECVGPSGDQLRIADWRQLGEPSRWEPERGATWTGTLAEAKSYVAHLVDQVETAWGGRQPEPEIRIEFVLDQPELATLDVEDWPWEEGPYADTLGRRYLVVLRSAERMRTGRYRRDWERRWSTFVTQLARRGRVAAQNGLRGTGNDDASLRRLAGALGRQRDAVSLVLSAAPQAADTDRGEIVLGLRSGIPLIVWNRHHPTARFESEIDTLIHGTDDPLHLLERFRSVRIEAFTEGAGGAHVGNGLAVVYDDPNRTVIPNQPQPPVEEGGAR